MSKKNKHLTYTDRVYLETGLNCGKSFKELAEALNKNRTTIMREVQKHK